MYVLKDEGTGWGDGLCILVNSRLFVMANETDHRSVYDASSLCYSIYICCH